MPVLGSESCPAPCLRSCRIEISSTGPCFWIPSLFCAPGLSIYYTLATRMRVIALSVSLSAPLCLDPRQLGCHTPASASIPGEIYIGKYPGEQCFTQNQWHSFFSELKRCCRLVAMTAIADATEKAKALMLQTP